MNEIDIDRRLSCYEIMAPVGSWECLYAAIKAGADAIYFGVESLNMRAHSSSHFSCSDLKVIAEECDKHHV